MTKPSIAQRPPHVEKIRTRFTIPCFPHVKKFIQKNYRVKGDVLQEDEYSVLGKMVTLCLKDKREAEDNDQYRDRLTDSITIVLTSRQASMSPKKGKLMRLNLHVDSLYKEHMMVWVQALKEEGYAPYTATQMFINYYGLGEKDLINAHQYQMRLKKKK
jgi:hypothetical protein